MRCDVCGRKKETATFTLIKNYSIDVCHDCVPDARYTAKKLFGQFIIAETLLKKVQN